MFQKLLNFYTPSTCKHMHQHKNIKLKMTQFSIFQKLTKNRSSSNLYLKYFENESLDKAGYSPFKTKNK
ncbi:hypothetical protein NC651_014994 [Populus alba x Populus x berolinensis]|nr:hypothetical protein NC651_014994 [Populus alba x Populus x berolinensis]